MPLKVARRRRRAARLAGLAAAAALFWGAGTAGAHDLELTRVVLAVDGGAYRAEMTVDLDALALGAGPSAPGAELVARLEALEPAERERVVERLRRSFERRVRIFFDGQAVQPRVSFPEAGSAAARAADEPSFLGLTARLEGSVPEGAEEVSFRASRAFPPVDLTVLWQGDMVSRQLLERGVPSAPYRLGERPAAGGALAVAGRYLALGFEHILPAGLDHVLFILGLFLLSPRLRPLVWQVTAFTAAHALTLTLATYGLVTLPAAVVEPLIALSIAYVGIENLFTTELKPWRPLVVFAFGLLHGLGFAGVLAELGLPAGEALAALVSFNVGIELGQLAVLALAFLVLGHWRHRPWYRPRVAVPLSLLVAAVALYWAIERIFAGG